MSLSKKIESTKFNKSVAGYNVKEVDAFIADIIPRASDYEDELISLRSVALEYSARKNEITDLKKEACELLEAAKAQAEKMLAEAREKAAKITDEARISAEASIRVGEITANDITDKAEKQASECVASANANASKIIELADKKGREMLAEAKAKYDEQTLKTEKLADEYNLFETKFKDIVSDTAKALFALREDSVAVMTAKAPAREVPVSAPMPETAEEAAPEPEVIPTPVMPEPETAAPIEEEVVDFSFAGGKLISSGGSGGKGTRRLFDAVQVTYDSDDDDFEDVKSLMREGNAKTRKSPTHFSE